jgi:hypothetical protein
VTLGVLLFDILIIERSGGADEVWEAQNPRRHQPLLYPRRINGLKFIGLLEMLMAMTEEQKDRRADILERIALIISTFVLVFLFAHLAIIFFEDLLFSGPSIEVLEELPIPGSD